MIYARVHYQTVADDYYAAMGQVEKRLELFANQENSQQLSDTATRSQLLDLTIRLVALELDQEEQIKIATQMRRLNFKHRNRSIRWFSANYNGD